MEIEIGENFLGFKILKLIGRGGFGSVYLGKKVNLTSNFPYPFAAIKVLHQMHCDDEKKVHRFHREARLALKLSHPNVIKILDDGEIEGTHYIIMELATGKTLLEYLNGESLNNIPSPDDSNNETDETITKTMAWPLSDETISLHDKKQDEDNDETVSINSLDETLWIKKNDEISFTKEPKWKQAVILMEQCAEVLSVANQVGLIHRDIKPENILLQKDSSGKVNVKILDFGLAKDTIQDTMQISIEGQALGTPQYMSPEQFEGKKADIRSDLYSLGATFYCFLAGKKPFKGPTINELMKQILIETPKDLTKIDSSIDPNCSFIINKLMRKNRNERYQTPAQLIDDLQKAFRGEKPYDYKPVTKIKKRLSFIIVGFFCSIAFFWLFRNSFQTENLIKNDASLKKQSSITPPLTETLPKKNNLIDQKENDDKTVSAEAQDSKENPSNEIDTDTFKEDTQTTKNYVVGFEKDFGRQGISTTEKDRMKLIMNRESNRRK